MSFNLFDTVSGNESFVEDAQSSGAESVSQNTVSGNSVAWTESMPEWLADEYSSQRDMMSLQSDALSSIANDVHAILSQSSSGQFIPEPYLSYMNGLLAWCDLDDNYVCYSVYYELNYNRYTYYVMIVSDDLQLNGSNVSGTDADVYTFYPNNHTPVYEHSIESSVNVSLGSGFALTSLSSSYPTLTSLSDRSTSSVFYMLVGIVLFCTVSMFGKVSARIRRRVKRRHYTL